MFVSLEEKQLLQTYLNARDAMVDGFHAYFAASGEGSMWLARQFSSQGLDVNTPNFDGSTALTWAPNSEFTRFYISVGARVKFEAKGLCELSLHRAAAQGRSDQLELLLADGEGLPFLNHFNDIRMTPLSVAVDNGNFGTSKLLLEAGADPNLIHIESTDMTNLQLAVSKGYERIAHLLLDFGARLDTFGLHFSPLGMANELGLSDELSKRLIE